MGDFFREIDEELRQERLEKLWRNYGKYMIAVAVLVVVAVAGYQGWRQYERSQREAESARFAAALRAAAEGKLADAQALFSSLGRETSSGYGTLARLHEAAIRAQSGDREGAISVYDSIAADDSVDEPLRDAAVILASMHRLSDSNADLSAIRARLEPLAAKDSAWRYSALELLALVARKQGKTDEARGYLRQVADDPQAPRAARTRAAQLLAVMRG